MPGSWPARAEQTVGYPPAGTVTRLTNDSIALKVASDVDADQRLDAS